MDLRKAENQNPSDGPSNDGSVERLRSFVQDLLCFLILFMIALLVVSAVFFLIDDWSNMQQSNDKRRLIMKVQQPTVVHPGSPSSDLVLQDRHIKQMESYYMSPRWWRRMFHCNRQHAADAAGDASTKRPIGSVSNASLLESSTPSIVELEKTNEVTNTVQDNSKLTRLIDYVYRPS